MFDDDDEAIDQQHYVMTDDLNVQVATTKSFYAVTIHNVKTVEQAEERVKKWVAKNCKGEDFVSMQIISTTSDRD